MKQRKIYKTVVKIEVLSDEPIPENAPLEGIVEAINYGSSSGKITNGNSVEVIGQDAVRECEKHGTDPEFFMMDYMGNEIDET